jgi:hypothetical protein
MLSQLSGVVSVAGQGNQAEEASVMQVISLAAPAGYTANAATGESVSSVPARFIPVAQHPHHHHQELSSAPSVGTALPGVPDSD